MFDINELVGSITGHCTLCHKKSSISIMNGGLCMACKIDLGEGIEAVDYDLVDMLETVKTYDTVYLI